MIKNTHGIAQIIPTTVSMNQILKEWLELFESSDVPVELRDSIAKSFASTNFKVNLAKEKYARDASQLEQDIINQLKLLDQLAENPIATYNVKGLILMALEQATSYPIRTAPQSRVSINHTSKYCLEQKHSKLAALIDVLCDEKCHKSKLLDDHKIEFIISPNKLKLWSAPSVSSFVGMMVRPVYKKLAKAIMNKLQTDDEDDIVICGTPGIGKSMFGVYFIYLFITSRDDEMWTGFTHLAYDIGRDYVFLFERGKREFKCEYRHEVTKHVESSGGSWSSLIQLADGFPIQLETHSIDGRLVYITSPHILGKAGLDKDIPPLRFYMPIWSLEELKLCNDVMKIVDNELLQHLYDHFGGNARHVLFRGSSQGALEQIKILNDEILALNAEKLLDYVLKNDLSTDVSMPLIHYIANDDLTDRYFLFVSEYIQKKVMEILYRKQKSRLISFHRASAGSYFYHGLRGIVFESVAHEYFVTRKSSEYLTIKSLDETLHSEIQIPKPTKTYQFTKKNVESFIQQHNKEATQYYFAPTDEKFETVDSFILPNVCLQMTESTSHELRITDDLVKIIDIMQANDPNVQSCVFVWVMPADVYDQFNSKANITFGESKNETKATNEKNSIGATDEKKQKVAKMIKQYKMAISVDDKLWERLCSNELDKLKLEN